MRPDLNNLDFRGEFDKNSGDIPQGGPNIPDSPHKQQQQRPDNLFKASDVHDA